MKRKAGRPKAKCEVAKVEILSCGSDDMDQENMSINFKTIAPNDQIALLYPDWEIVKRPFDLEGSLVDIQGQPFNDATTSDVYKIYAKIEYPFSYLERLKRAVNGVLIILSTLFLGLLVASIRAKVSELFFNKIKDTCYLGRNYLSSDTCKKYFAIRKEVERHPNVKHPMVWFNDIPKEDATLTIESHACHKLMAEKIIYGFGLKNLAGQQPAEFIIGEGIYDVIEPQFSDKILHTTPADIKNLKDLSQSILETKDWVLEHLDHRPRAEGPLINQIQIAITTLLIKDISRDGFKSLLSQRGFTDQDIDHMTPDFLQTKSFLQTDENFNYLWHHINRHAIVVPQDADLSFAFVEKLRRLLF